MMDSKRNQERKNTMKLDAREARKAEVIEILKDAGALPESAPSANLARLVHRGLSTRQTLLRISGINVPYV